jgi:hypothetical protein
VLQPTRIEGFRGRGAETSGGGAASAVGGGWAVGWVGGVVDGEDGDEAEELDDGVDRQRRSLGCGRSLKTNEA